MYKWLIITVMVICITRIVSAQPLQPVYYSEEGKHWADSVLNTMSRDERIAQLMMVSAWSNKDYLHIIEIRNLVGRYGIGGLIFFQGGPMREAFLTNEYQRLAKIPLLIGMDAEYGLAMRIDSTLRFPRQMTMTAIDDDSAVYRMGEEIAKNCKRLGIHINFAPDADINNNPLNPIIGSRSFSDDRDIVSENSIQYMNALQKQHVLPTGKHFPGHGNVDSDSHLTLPTVFQDRSSLDSIELYPFRKMVNAGLGGIMVAHLNVPALDSTPDLPSTLSVKIVTGLLRKEMGFNGLIFTDALNMKGVSMCYRPGAVEVAALQAGNDVLICGEDVPTAIREIHYAIENCVLDEEIINTKARNILMLKYWCGLNKRTVIDTKNLVEDLNSDKGRLLQRSLYEKSVTVLTNKDSLLPFRGKDSLRVASVVFGDKLNNDFQQQLKMYAPVDVYSVEKEPDAEVQKALFNFLRNYDYVILSIHGTSMKAQNGFNISDLTARFIDSVMATYNSVFVDFGNTYTLTRFKNLNKARASIISYEDFYMTHSITAQVIMGGIQGTGRLPVTSVYERGSGVSTGKTIRLGYTIPEAVGLSSEKLNAIDTIVRDAINACAMPGCQILVARHGQVVYQKSFGTFTYGLRDTVKNNSLYDIASVTKIMATSLGVMKLYDKKKIDFTHPLYKYLPKTKQTNKGGLWLKDIMTHQAGLQPYIPFYKETKDENGLSKTLYSDSLHDDFTIKVADHIYLRKDYADSIKVKMYNSELSEKGKYVYSDLGPMLMKEVIEHVSDEPFDKYITDNFYKPLYLSRTSFNPLNKFLKNEIVPTEEDTTFRHQLLQGYVHDPSAAMLGGVSGNAGLFSTANDLAVIMQMLLNKGEYGGKRFLKESTVELFTGKQFPDNRRGLLFDKPETDSNKASPCAKSASPSTFGHQGFTGTCAWADPENDLIYIFLSNRVNPDATNDKLVKMNVRTSIQQVVYDAIIK
jgi:beta-N-acetylhexosaminidase